jgi:hypothetical protein
MANTIAVISGISSMLINVRVGMGSALRANHLIATTQSRTFPSQLEGQSNSNSGRQNETDQIPSFSISPGSTTEVDQTGI